METVVAGDDEANGDGSKKEDVEDDDVIAALFVDDDTATCREIFAISTGTSSEKKKEFNILSILKIQI